MNAYVLLMDNGSLEPASTRQLRELAAALAARVGRPVAPVSLAHSDKIDPARLDGRPAELFEATLDRLIAAGVRDVVVAPQFIGPSLALTRHVPAVIAERRAHVPELRVALAPPLFAPGETQLGEILAEHVREQIAKSPGQRPRVAIVDHGSPARAVTEVRDAVAAQVRARLADEAIEVAGCSMERREGAEFDFNEPTLEHLLARLEWRTAPLVIGMLFLAPGRHAGPDGDVAQIVRAARGDDPAVRFTKLLGANPRLIEILAERVEGAIRPRAGGGGELSG